MSLSVLPGTTFNPTNSAIGGIKIGPTDAKKVISIDVMAQEVNPDQAGELVDQAGALLPSDPKRAALMKQASDDMLAKPGAIAAITAFAKKEGLTITQAPGASDADPTFHLSGTVAAMDRAFGLKLSDYKAPVKVARGVSSTNYTFYSYRGNIHVPSKLSAFISAVIGLNSNQVAVPLAP